MNKTKIPKIPELVRTSERVTSPPDTKSMRQSIELIESFIFCRRSPLNSQNSQQESSVKLGFLNRNRPKCQFLVKKADFSKKKPISPSSPVASFAICVASDGKK